MSKTPQISEETQKHTQGKLAVQGENPANDNWYPGITIYSVDEDTRVADACSLDFRARANAARLVHCWNTHDLMVEALEKAREQLFNDCKQSALVIINAALTNARGQK